MDFSLTNRIHPDPYNNNETERRDNMNQESVPVVVGDNDLWTALSWAVYGFIVLGGSSIIEQVVVAYAVAAP